MEKISLNGVWSLYYAPEKQLPETPEALALSDIGRVEATVPGNVELDLFRAGVCPDPFFGENLYEFRKYEFYGWWYTRVFTVDEDFLRQRVTLFLGGVDTFADVYVNGVKALTADNMMREYEAEVGGLLHAGENTIAVRIASAVNRAREMDYPAGVRGPGWEHTDEMICVRKPGHCFGWDIAPRFVSAGLWRGVELRRQKKTRIRETYLETLSATERSASVLVKCRFETDDEYLEDFAVRVEGACGESRFDKLLKVKFVSDEITFTVDRPKLWWPKGYGEANLYDVTISLMHCGEVVDQRRERLGIRTAEVEARFETGDAGEFKVLVNHVPILIKGANWVPLDAFHSRDAQRVQQAVGLFAEAGCNIVRCWGGNVYEDHRFYDLCDENGILVWQDFSLACAIYPQDDAFARIVEDEAVQIVRKLRNHPCILLWSGDNEVDAMYYNFGYLYPHVRDNRISREVLPRVTAGHDPLRYYLPSSPFVPLHIVGDLNVPEQHNWGPRDYFKGDFYKHSTAHFISEIGYHGCPSVGSLRRFISEDCLWPIQNGEWDAHNTEYTKCIRDRGYDRNQLMVDQVTDMFGETPEALERFAMLSQASQAEAVKFFIENVRLHKWRKTGIIWWNMLDCWPQISDAVVDYYFHRKLAFHYIRRVQQPICLIVAEAENWHHEVVLCNDSRMDAEVRYIVADGETGETLLEGVEISRANENLPLGRIKTYSGVQRLLTLSWSVDGKPGANHYVTGYPAFDGDRYRRWIDIISALEEPFDAPVCWRDE